MLTAIAQVLDLLHGGNLVEIRAIGVPGGGSKRSVWSGYFDDYLAAAKAVEGLEAKKPAGIYVTLNTIHPGLIARAPNRIEQSPAHSTTNAEIVGRRWLLIDVDPCRPAGISSTDQELAWARGVRDEIADWLADEFAGQRLLRACSGNGYHCLLETDVDTAEQEGILVALESWFGRPEVVIDKSVTKPAQLTKLYGTWARKGYSYGDRMHRRSYLES